MSHVAWSVVGHMGELCKNGWINHKPGWVVYSCGTKEPCTGWAVHISTQEGAILRGKGHASPS